MVLGQLMRSIGLKKTQAVNTENPSDTASVSTEESINYTLTILGDSETLQEKTGQDSDRVTETGDEDMSEDSDSSGRTLDVIDCSDVFCLKMLLQYRTAIDVLHQDAPDVVRTATLEELKRYDLQGSADSPKAHSDVMTPKSQQSEVMTPTAGSWLTAMQRKRSMSEPDDDTVVTRKACSILNKLTIEKFDALYEQLATCGIRKPEHLEILMREVFNKATTQHHFIAMYADLCVRLGDDDRVVVTGGQHSFQQLLVKECQTAFGLLLKPAERPEESKDVEMDEEYAVKCKQQAIGNIKLIGHLLMRGIVPSELFVEYSEELLRARASCPEALESLVALIAVAGKHFDTKSWQHRSRLLEIFASMRKLSKDKKVQARQRFLIRDILDVLDAGWNDCTYKATMTASPMKLDEVRESKVVGSAEQAETNHLLAGLMHISKIANAKNEHVKDQVEGSKTIQGEPPPRKQEPSRCGPPPRKHEPSQGGLVWRAKPREVPEQAAGGLGRCKEKESTRSSLPSPQSKPEFDPVSFHRALATTLDNLASDRNVAAAVESIRSHAVPVKLQPQEFADIMTRIVEERRGPIRRCGLALAAALAEEGAFDRGACLNGVGQFFHDVYPQMCKEIPRLPAIVKSELLPTFVKTAFSEGVLYRRLPDGLGWPATST